ncbi:MAG: hypothetical protein FRX48_07100 [Lasallia pustulata]|uniref:Uncharacterized protein n=1 Tax=Lasallia pustulata TaxID=136370 RepID=A0A5M8PH76_9LECA|nr:MAG: hypothetical protein FRX48_07100 [Lasallia pustulata]
MAYNLQSSALHYRVKKSAEAVPVAALAVPNRSNEATTRTVISVALPDDGEATQMFCTSWLGELKAGRALIDTGSIVNIMSEQMLSKLPDQQVHTDGPSTSDNEEDNTMDLPNQTGAYGLKLKMLYINPAELLPLPSLFDNAGPTIILMSGAGSDIHSDDNNAPDLNDASDSINDAPNLINPSDFIDLSSIIDMSDFTNFTEPTAAPLLATDEYMTGTPNHAEEGMDKQMGGMNENKSIALSITVGGDQDMIDGQPSHWWMDPSPRAFCLRGSIPPA